MTGGVALSTDASKNFSELFSRHLGLAEDRSERPWSQFTVERHNDRCVVSPKLHVTAALADLGEAVLPQGSDDGFSAQQWERRAHAESWKVVTTGVSKEAGSD